MSTAERLSMVAFLAALMVGCAGEASFSEETLSHEGRKAYQLIRLVDGLATNDFSRYASYGPSLKTSLGLVASKEEKVWLLKDLERRIESINYDDMPSARSEYAYVVVGDAFCAIQDISYEIHDGRAAALEVWFREMSYFASELAHCQQKSQTASTKGDVNEKERYQGRIEKCETAMAKTLYRIDFNRISSV